MNIVQRNPAALATGRFAFSEAPIPGESLMGFIARNADIHGVDKVASALLPAGLDNPKTEAFATAYEEQADVLAALFMTTPDEIRSRMYLPWAGREATEVNFHGTHIRPRYLRWRQRRFSPASLRVSGHHRAMWDLAVLSFCPESKEMLVSGCPSCGESLGWRYTLGIRTCEWCEADLTKVAAEPVRCHDIEALDFACDLVNPDPGRREKAQARVPERLAALDTGELFEFVMNLACLLLTEPDASRMVRLQSREDLERVTPDIIAEAGRLVMGWPTTMHTYAAELRSRAHLRPGFWGARKELGQLLWLTREKETSIAPVAKEALREIVQADMEGAGGIAQRIYHTSDEVMTFYEAFKEFQLRRPALNRIVERNLVWNTVRKDGGKEVILFRRQEMADLRAEMADMTGRGVVSRMLGVDYLATERLADAGLLARVSPAAAATARGDHYRTSSVVELQDRLLGSASRQARSDACHSLSAVAARATASVVPWVGLIKAVLSREIPVLELSGDADLPLTDRLGIPSYAAWAADALPTETMPAGEDRFITTFEAAAMLEVSDPSISYLTNEGGVAKGDDGFFALRAGDMLALRQQGMSTKEVARRIGGDPAIVARRLGRLGVPLAYASANRKLLLWDRGAAEAAFDRLREG